MTFNEQLMTGDDDGDGLSTMFSEVEENDGDDVCDTFDLNAGCPG